MDVFFQNLRCPSCDVVMMKSFLEVPNVNGHNNAVRMYNLMNVLGNSNKVESIAMHVTSLVHVGCGQAAKVNLFVRQNYKGTGENTKKSERLLI